MIDKADGKRIVLNTQHLKHLEQAIVAFKKRCPFLPAHLHQQTTHPASRHL